MSETTAASQAFDTLPLSPAMLANLAQLEYLSMTPIQAASLPLAPWEAVSPYRPWSSARRASWPIR